MSPEQATADQLDGRSDIYSLGCVLYEMLAGEPPYTGPTAQAVIAKRFSEPIPHVRTLRETVSEPLAQALQKALAKAPVDRFATAAEMASALAGVSASRDVPRRRPWRVAAAWVGLSARASRSRDRSWVGLARYGSARASGICGAARTSAWSRWRAPRTASRRSSTA